MAEQPKEFFKVVPAREAGYGEGWIVRKWYPDIGRWFDVGDPVATRAEAEIKLFDGRIA